MAMRKRSGSGAKRQHKCKLVPIYESFFKGEDLTLAHPNFWNELFLIKPMVHILELFLPFSNFIRHEYCLHNNVLGTSYRK